MTRLSLLLIGALFVSVSFAQSPLEKGLNSIDKNTIEGQVQFLVSDLLEGREMGQKGAYLSSEYIASLMKIYGLKPYNGSYFQSFDLFDYKPVGNQYVSFTINKNGKEKIIEIKEYEDFKLRASEFSQEIITKDIVFVGYGLIDKYKKYDDYENIDVKGKYVFYLEGYPGHMDELSDAYKKFNTAGVDYKQNIPDKYITARSQGAKGVIHIADENNITVNTKNKSVFVRGENYEGYVDFETFHNKNFSSPPDSINKKNLEIIITEDIANQLFKGSDVSVKKFEKNCAKEFKPNSFILKDVSLHIKTNIESKKVACRNVAGIIKGKDTTKMIVVGAHFDHYGKYGGYVWNGADDNASGVSGVLAIAKAFVETNEMPEHNLVFVAFTGEEKGLFGSRYFANHIPENINVEYMLNLDMISRNSYKDTAGNQCLMIYKEGYENIKDLFNTVNQENNLGLDLTYWPTDGKGGGSDHAPFGRRGIPFSFFWSGWHDDYHQPTDDIWKLNWAKMLSLCKLGFIHTYYIDKNGLKQ